MVGLATHGATRQLVEAVLMNRLSREPGGDRILVSHTFPLSLIRRRVEVIPRLEVEMIAALHEHDWLSAWGHENTLRQACIILGADLRPARPRPAVILDEAMLPTLDGVTFRECWVLSANLEPGYRPALGEEVPTDKIYGWSCLQIIWPA